jgi:hypothetical protein
LFGLVGIAAFQWLRTDDNAPSATPRSPPADDPRLTITTPYQNVRLEVRYVGDDACADCHPSISKSFHLHPMGRSLAPISTASVIERFAAENHNPFEASGFVYRAARQNERIVHSESIKGGGVESRAEMAYAVGSGRRGRSYLIDHDGFLFQSPVSWYPLKGVWDLSPGYDEFNQHFSRPIIGACLFCHCNQVEPDAHAANRYATPIFRGHAIGCERCHGPGQLHVDRQSSVKVANGVDTSIVNPRRLDHPLREAVCQQCHLQGEARILVRGRSEFDYRPGLPLSRFVADFVRPADQRPENKFVGTVEQMYASRCFLSSAGEAKLGCISCHDPHVLPALDQREGFFRDRCLECHKDRGCSLPAPVRLAQSATDSCIACHMPKRSGSVVHTAITDHTIPRHASDPTSRAKANAWPRAGQAPLMAFPPDSPSASDADRNRSLGLALVDAARKTTSGPSGRPLAELALPLLNAATAGDPLDVPAWEAKGSALMLAGRPDEAVVACNAALAIDPERETSLFLAGVLAMGQKRPEQARSFAERAIRVNPWMWQYHQMLAEARVQMNDWKGAADSCQQAIKLEPANLSCRQLLIRCYLRLGDTSAARGELDACLILMPPAERENFRRAIEQQLR